MKFFTFVCHFCPPGSGSGFQIRIRIYWPDWIRIQFGSGTLMLNSPWRNSWHPRRAVATPRQYSRCRSGRRCGGAWTRSCSSHRGCGRSAAEVLPPAEKRRTGDQRCGAENISLGSQAPRSRKSKLRLRLENYLFLLSKRIKIVTIYKNFFSNHDFFFYKISSSLW